MQFDRDSNADVNRLSPVSWTLTKMKKFNYKLHDLHFKKMENY